MAIVDVDSNLGSARGLFIVAIACSLSLSFTSLLGESRQDLEFWHHGIMTKKGDVSRVASERTFGRGTSRSILQSAVTKASCFTVGDYERAVAVLSNGDDSVYLGAQANISVWKPKVENPDWSSSMIWISGGTDEIIMAGWQVNPTLYGDNETRLTIYWNDASGKGCHNDLCDGFVHNNRTVVLGSKIYPTSDANGKLYEIDIRLQFGSYGNETGWWLFYGEKTCIGYWPAQIFDELATSARMIMFGGEVTNMRVDGSHTSTQMGSGEFPEESHGGVSYFHDIRYLDSNSNLQIVGEKDVNLCADQPQYYDINWNKNVLFYGGRSTAD